MKDYSLERCHCASSNCYCANIKRAENKITALYNRHLEKAGITFDAVVSLEISDEEIVERMGGRRVCASCGAPFHVKNLPPKVEGVCDACGAPVVQRADDKPETVRERLRVYHEQTEPLKDYYEKQGIVHTIDGTQTMDQVFSDIRKILGV